MIEATFVKPVLVSFWGLNLYSYGVCVASALGSCTYALNSQLERLKIECDAAIMLISFLPGFAIGSKAQMVFSAYLSGEPMPNLWIDVGHSFMGSAVGGVLSAAVYGWYCGIRPLQLLDLITPLVPLGHGIGKWGCFLSGDGCYGPKSEVPWAMSFPKGGVPTTEFVHPTALYESVLSLTLFIFVSMILWIPSPDERALQVGKRAAVTLMLYGVERMLIEPFRRHPPSSALFGLTEYQFLAVIFIIIGAVVLDAGRRSEPWGSAEQGKSDGKAKKKTKKNTQKED
eukprot:gnl/TRDRNA2_/TRDRNA2_193002_c0_seq1.p1 gnl/TRDRNA2_/TRDRNA2_193002_c0~~gnl/TRDRNA2_/TRDRNA2_193002_c0_seq1.p1  ORF type:complete len:302 (+),score=39.24 gnl/TRDRNA2_/TRDRNA2_193002_c0_seq1:54-908(+)